MAIATSIGPVETDVRDEVAQYRDSHGFDNYNEAIKAMLREVDTGP